MTSYPTLDQLIQSGKRQKLLVVRRSLRSLIWHFLTGFVAIWLVYKLNFQFDLPALRWLGFLPGVVFLEIVRQYYNDLYVLGMHQITNYHGRISFSYNVPVVKYVHLRSISVKQSILGRIIGYGDILMETAAHEGSELRIHGVADPVHLATLLEELRNRSRRTTDTDLADSESDEGQASD